MYLLVFRGKALWELLSRREELLGAGCIVLLEKLKSGDSATKGNERVNLAHTLG